MVNTKDNPMITGSILHHKIIEKLGEVLKLPLSVFVSRCLGFRFQAGFWRAERVAAILRISPLFRGSGNQLEELL